MNVVAAVAAGLLLAASDHPLHFWPLQFVALVPLWWALARRSEAGRSAWVLGLAFASANTLAVLTSAGWQLPLLVAGVAALLQWTIAAWLAARCLARGPVLGPLAAAAMVTLVELATWRLAPMFGTAQAFVRPLSAAPMLVGFVAFTGTGGLVFVVAALQALVACALRGPIRGRPLAAAAATIAIVAALDAVRWQRPLGPTVRVATFGWGETTPQSPDGKPFVHRAAAAALAEKCTLLVTPETGMHVGDRRNAARVFSDVATGGTLHMALGVWHGPTNDNRIWFVAPDNSLVGEYRKTHLVPWLENYATGDGAPVVVPFGDLRLGGMICQDDNFTDVARAYGAGGVPLLAVPTNDWPAIREFHLENAIFRSIENGYAAARAASGGISAIVSARGEVIARDDHVTARLDSRLEANVRSIVAADDGPDVRLLCADVTVGDGVPTIYARFGDTPMLVLCALLVVVSLRRGSKPKPAA